MRFDFTAREYRNADGREISRTNKAPGRSRVFFVRRREPFHLDREGAIESVEQRAVGVGHPANTWNRTDASCHLVIKIDRLSSNTGTVQIDKQQILSWIAVRNTQQIAERMQKGTRA